MTEELIDGRYRLVERLGRGAMSEVWRGEDLELERPVALKLLGAQADRERFRREARAVAAAAHPNINQVYDYGEAGGRPYMVLELLTGGSLEDRLGGRPLPDDETRSIATGLAAGLAHAHERGLVHRDLKPANVLFDGEGRAKIADFGIARVAGGGTLTEAGTVLGTATTISPEQAAGEQAGPASDVYSFGVLLYWMLTGRPPFVGTQPLELVAQHRDDAPPPIASLRPDAPADLASLATASLAKDPADRPPDGEALQRELLAGPAGAATALIAPAPRPRRVPLLVPVVVVLAALAAAGAAVAFVFAGKPAPALATSSTPASLALPSVGSTASTQPAVAAPPTTTTQPATSSTTATPAATRARPTTTAPAATTAPPATTATVVDTTTVPPPTDTSTQPPGTPQQGTTTVVSAP